MWDTNILQQKLEQLKQIKELSDRHVEFWVTGYTDSLNTMFADTSLDIKENWLGECNNELVVLLLDTAINYLEEKIKEKVWNKCILK
jgi:hypothetical protein